MLWEAQCTHVWLVGFWLPLIEFLNTERVVGYSKGVLGFSSLPTRMENPSQARFDALPFQFFPHPLSLVPTYFSFLERARHYMKMTGEKERRKKLYHCYARISSPRTCSYLPLQYAERVQFC